MTILEQKLNAYSRRVSRIQSTIDREMTDILRKNEHFLVDLNQSQLLEGKDSFGMDMGDRKPYRSPKYAAFKARINPLPGFGNPDLRLTGDYWDGMRAIVKNREITMMSTDSKASDLESYRGMGISPDNTPEIADLIRRLMKLIV